jgi:hypothetical protein
MKLARSNTRYRHNPDIMTASVADGMVLMSIQRGAYYSLDELGTRLWALHETPCTLDEACSQLVREYDVDPAVCLAEMGTLLQELVGEEILLPDTER